MKIFEVKVKVQAPDIMQATMMADGVQNVLNEMGKENQQFFLELSDKQAAKNLVSQITKAINNPVIKSVFGI